MSTSTSDDKGGLKACRRRRGSGRERQLTGELYRAYGGVGAGQQPAGSLLALGKLGERASRGARQRGTRHRTQLSHPLHNTGEREQCTRARLTHTRAAASSKGRQLQEACALGRQRGTCRHCRVRPRPARGRPQCAWVHPRGGHVVWNLLHGTRLHRRIPIARRGQARAHCWPCSQARHKARARLACYPARCSGHVKQQGRTTRTGRARSVPDFSSAGGSAGSGGRCWHAPVAGCPMPGRVGSTWPVRSVSLACSAAAAASS